MAFVSGLMVFGLFFLIILLLLAAMFELGCVGIAGGIVGLSLRGRRKKRGLSFPRWVTAIAIVMLSLGILIASIPLGLVAIVTRSVCSPPANFVETEIVIEDFTRENSLRQFTADGVRYEELPLDLFDENFSYEPIFSYQPEGLFGWVDWCNYYAVPNGEGFSLVTDEFGTLFCPVEEKEEVLAHYKQIQNQWGYYWSVYYGRIKLTETEWGELKSFLCSDLNLFTTCGNAEFESFQIHMVCQEPLVCAGYYDFLKNGDDVYFVYEKEFGDAPGGLIYTLAKVPPKTAKWMLDYYALQHSSAEADPSQQ